MADSKVWLGGPQCIWPPPVIGLFVNSTLWSGKLVKIGATRCRILRLKCTKFAFRWHSAPDLAGVAYCAPPDPLAVFKGPTSKGRERKIRWREGFGPPKYFGASCISSCLFKPRSRWHSDPYTAVDCGIFDMLDCWMINLCSWSSWLDIYSVRLSWPPLYPQCARARSAVAVPACGRHRFF